MINNFKSQKKSQRVNQKFLFILASSILTLSSAFAQVDPKIQWKVLTLPHFDLIYDAKHQELASLYGDRLEDNLRYLKKYFEVIPERTTVVLNDRTDLTNGYATAVPYRTMMLFPVLPGPSETISEYGDWARELTMHEMTHILSFEPRRGFVKGLYYTFGNIITPNMLLPRWWLEGVAVDLETRTSEKGRLRSVYQDGSLRSFIVDNKLLDMTISEMNETSIPTWPQGGRPYLFGSLMWSQMLADYGDKATKELHWQYGGRVPFFIESPFFDLTDRSYQDYFEKVKQDIQARGQRQISELQKQKISQGIAFPIKNSIETFFPEISPNGKNMIFLSKSDTGKRSVVILQRGSLDIPFDDSQRLAKLDQKMEDSGLDKSPLPKLIELDHEDSPPAGVIQRLSWFPDSQKFIYDQVQELDRFHEVSDLYTFDLKSLRRERLTTGERAREAAVSPHSRQIAFIKLGAGRMTLAILNIETKSVEIIYTPALQNRISWPVYLNEHEILFTERSEGRETLQKISLIDKKIVSVLSDYPEAKYPTMTAMGLIFTSAKNGVSNIYLANNKLTEAKPLTHSATLMAAASYDSSRNELYASQLSSQGFHIERFDQNSWQNFGKDLPKIEPLLNDRYPSVKAEVLPVDKSRVEDYSAWPYMYPRYWLPSFSYDENGSLFGASTSNTDPLGKHVYQIAGSYDFAKREPNASFLYQNNSTDAVISLYGLDYYTNIINTSSRFRQQQYQLSALWQILPVSTDLYSGFGWSWAARQFSSVRREQNGPSWILNYQDYVQSGAQISPESGQAIGLQATEFLDNKALENEAFRLYQYSLQKYFSGWAPHHAVMLRAQGQYIDGQVSSPNYAFNLGIAPFANIAGGGLVSPFYIVRGYRNGQFLGKSLNTANFEYRFPLQYFYRGPSDTTPLFIRRLHASVLADAANVDGFVYKSETERFESAERQKIFWSYGAEIKLDITLGYHIPMTIYFGYYFPANREFTNGNSAALSIQL